MDPKENPDYAEVQAIIWDHMQMLIDKLLEEEPSAHITSHSSTGK